MDWDWQALGAALRARRQVLHLTQEELGRRAGVSAATIKNYERGARTYDKIPKGAIQLEQAIGWETGSTRAVLEGGEPTLAEPAAAALAQTRRVLHEGDQEPWKPLSERLPTSVLSRLENGEVYATDTYDLTVDGGMMMIVVVMHDPDDPGHPKDFAKLRRENRAWSRMQRMMRGLEPLKWEPGDPEEWKEDSGTATGE